MSKVIDVASDIPAAPFYVCANDKALSGWGRAARRTNTLIFPCYNWQDVTNVLDRVQFRPEMKYVRVNYTKPRLKDRGYLYSLFDANDPIDSYWYKKEVR